jgi:hypothetical protein
MSSAVLVMTEIHLPVELEKNQPNSSASLLSWEFLFYNNKMK